MSASPDAAFMSYHHSEFLTSLPPPGRKYDSESLILLRALMRDKF